MKANNRKIASLFMTAVLTASLFAGCGDGSSGAAASDSAAENGSDAAENGSGIAENSAAGAGDGAAAGTESGTSGDGELTTVRINQAFQSLLYLPLYVAEDAGFFEEEGIAAERSTAGGGPQSWSAVLGGSADFALGDPVFVAMSHYEGGSGVVFASIQNAPTVWIVGTEDIDLSTDLTALEGKTIVTGAEPDTDWALFEYLKDSMGDDGSGFTETQTSIGSQIAPVLAGQADFALSCEPVVSEGIAEGLTEVFSFAEYEELTPMAFSCLMTSEEFISENPEAAQGVMNAIEKACQYIYSHPEEAMEIAKQEFPDTDPAVVEAAVQRMIDCKGYPEHALVTEQAWENNMKLALISGNIEEYPADYSNYETNVEVDMAMEAQGQ